ncbi:MAG: hypothetical protein ACTHJ3_16930 [Pararhizobium sp.]
MESSFSFRLPHRDLNPVSPRAFSWRTRIVIPAHDLGRRLALLNGRGGIFDAGDGWEPEPKTGVMNDGVPDDVAARQETDFVRADA